MTDTQTQRCEKLHTGPCTPTIHAALLDDPPWRAEVTTADVGGDKWSTNALRFASKEDALEYAANLARRWMLVTRWRAVDTSVALDQAYEEGSEDGRW